jgi:glycosyltransferase involved in cell wall biosynthesis
MVINDASTDNSDSVITNFKNEIYYIRNKRRLGLPGTLNLGIKKIKTPYFVRVDSDDYVNENFLIFLLNFIEFNKYMDAIACDYYLIDKNEKILQRVNCLEKPIGCGIIFKTDQIVKLGMYDKDFLLHEDKDLRKRFLKKFNIFRLELPLYRYRQHETNITKNKILDKRFKKKLLQ